MIQSKPCIRCLLRELGEKELLEKIAVYQQSIPAHEQASKALYQNRLKKCRQCECLNQGICGKCGCFVEARAYRSRSTCPHEQPRW